MITSLDEDALVEILDYWLKNDSYQPTWDNVGTALRKAAMDLMISMC